MKFVESINIALPRERVWALFDNPENLRRWQPALKELRHESGMKGETGAVSKLVYDENGKEITLTETVTERQKPELMCGEYDSGMAVNRMYNRFVDVAANETRWEMIAEFEFRGIVWKLLSPLLRPTIRKRLRADMARFRKFAEASAS